MFKKFFLLGSALLLICCLTATCNQPAQSPPPTPVESQPPPSTAEKPAEQTPPIDQATDQEGWSTVQTFTGKENKTTPPFNISGTKWRITWAMDAEYPENAVFEIFVYPQDTPSITAKRISYTAGAMPGGTVYIDGGEQDYYLKIIGANLRNWTIKVEDYATTTVIPPVQITYINYKGHYQIEDPDEAAPSYRDIIEADEYVEIKNVSDSEQNIAGWVLKNITKGSPPFTFPTFKPCNCYWYGDSWQKCVDNCYPPRPCVIEPRKSIRVYTGEVHAESGGFCLYYPFGDFWNNEKPDIAVLYDINGQEVSRKSYTIPTKE